jgi:hypothetical protein
VSDRIDLDDDGTPDDVVFDNVKSVHIERMDTGFIWMGVYLKNGTAYRCQFSTPRNGRLLWSVEADDVATPEWKAASWKEKLWHLARG